MLIAGVAMMVFGLAVYLVMPYSLVTTNLPLFFDILFGLLMCILLGGVLLALNFQYFMERLVCQAFALSSEGNRTKTKLA